MTFAELRPRWGTVGACARSVLLIAALARCAGTDMAGPGTLGSNIPAVGMENGHFGFAVTARDWTFDQSYAPGFATGTLQIGLVVAGYTGGTGQLT